MAKKILFLLACVMAFFVMWAFADEIYLSVGEDSMTVFFVLVSMVSAVFAQVLRPIGMGICYLVGVASAIYCGVSAFIIYALFAAFAGTMVRFDDEIRDWVCIFWTPDDSSSSKSED